MTRSIRRGVLLVALGVLLSPACSLNPQPEVPSDNGKSGGGGFGAVSAGGAGGGGGILGIDAGGGVAGSQNGTGGTIGGGGLDGATDAMPPNWNDADADAGDSELDAEADSPDDAADVSQD